MRVTDRMVESWLVWARNFGEIVAWETGRGGVRRFRVRLTPGITRNGGPFRSKEAIFDLAGHDADDVVPAEMMLTAREALVFGYGCAVGRAARLAAEPPTWCDGWTPNAREAFEARRQEAREANAADMQREAAEREAERLRRGAEFRRRRGGVQQINEGAS